MTIQWTKYVIVIFVHRSFSKTEVRRYEPAYCSLYRQVVFVYKWSYKTGFTVCIQYNYWMCLAQVLSFAERLVVYKPLYKGHYFRSLFPSAFPIHIHMHAVHAHAVHAHAEPLVANSPNSKNLSITNCLNLRVQTARLQYAQTNL
jgi:hypothetical protein